MRGSVTMRGCRYADALAVCDGWNARKYPCYHAHMWPGTHVREISYRERLGNHPKEYSNLQTGTQGAADFALLAGRPDPLLGRALEERGELPEGVEGEVNEAEEDPPTQREAEE